MEQLLTFIQAHWLALIVGVLGVIETIILIIKKPKIVDSFLQQTLELLPLIISQVEKEVGSKNGVFKKCLVINKAISFYKAIGGTADIQKYLENQVETILCTPQKKGEK